MPLTFSPARVQYVQCHLLLLLFDHVNSNVFLSSIPTFLRPFFGLPLVYNGLACSCSRTEFETSCNYPKSRQRVVFQELKLEDVFRSLFHAATDGRFRDFKFLVRAWHPHSFLSNIQNSPSEKAGFRKLSTCSSTNEEGVHPSADLNVGEPERSDGVDSEVSVFNTYLPFDDGPRLRVFDVMSMRFIQDEA